MPATASGSPLAHAPLKSPESMLAAVDDIDGLLHDDSYDEASLLGKAQAEGRGDGCFEFVLQPSHPQPPHTQRKPELVGNAKADAASETPKLAHGSKTASPLKPFSEPGSIPAAAAATRAADDDPAEFERPVFSPIPLPQQRAPPAHTHAKGKAKAVAAVGDAGAEDQQHRQQHAHESLFWQIFSPEEILDMRVLDGALEYRVKWQGKLKPTKPPHP